MKTRITTIETHLMHQEVAIQELNEVIIRQQRLIDDLCTDLALLKEQMQVLSPSMVRDVEEENPPPHY